MCIDMYMHVDMCMDMHIDVCMDVYVEMRVDDFWRLFGACRRRAPRARSNRRVASERALRALSDATL